MKSSGSKSCSPSPLPSPCFPCPFLHISLGLFYDSFDFLPAEINCKRQLWIHKPWGEKYGDNSPDKLSLNCLLPVLQDPCSILSGLQTVMILPIWLCWKFLASIKCCISIFQPWKICSLGLIRSCQRRDFGKHLPVIRIYQVYRESPYSVIHCKWRD